LPRIPTYKGSPRHGVSLNGFIGLLMIVCLTISQFYLP
jgi:hypothetical protein